MKSALFVLALSLAAVLGGCSSDGEAPLSPQADQPSIRIISESLDTQTEQAILRSLPTQHLETSPAVVIAISNGDVYATLQGTGGEFDLLVFEVDPVTGTSTQLNVDKKEVYDPCVSSQFDLWNCLIYCDGDPGCERICYLEWSLTGCGN